MAGLKIDLDRDVLYELPAERRPRGGVTHKQDPVTNAMVFMYKTDPGIYYSANGIRVSETMAARAGFDVKRLAQEKEKREKVKEFEAKYNAQLKDETRVTVAKRGQFALVRLPEDRYIVEDLEGNIMTRGITANSEAQGLDWLTDFAGPEVNGNGDVRRADDASEGGADRRTPADGRAGGNVGQSGRPKVAISA